MEIFKNESGLPTLQKKKEKESIDRSIDCWPFQVRSRIVKLLFVKPMLQGRSLTINDLKKNFFFFLYTKANEMIIMIFPKNKFFEGEEGV